MTENKDNSGLPIHPPVLAGLHLIAAFLMGWLLPVQLPGWTYYFGWVALLVGLGVASGGLRQLITAHTSPDPHTPTTSVVTTGIYRFTRNPIYFGFLCVVVGLPLIFVNPWGIVAALFQVFFFTRIIISREEAYLTGKFGQEYLDYKARVRRWI